MFAVSFILRPLGGIVWSPLGDRLGRSRILATTIILMCGATFLLSALVMWLALPHRLPADRVAALVPDETDTADAHDDGAVRGTHRKKA